MNYITLLTDFGLRDEYVGVMKGVLFSIAPHLSVIDISHHVAPQNIHEAAFLLRSAYPFFPKNTIHLVVVDPGVGTDRKILAVKIEDYLFLVPDNGIISLVIEEKIVNSIYVVENTSFFLSQRSQTFHGRDIFAPVAAHLANGLALDKLGINISYDQIVKLPSTEPNGINGKELTGSIISIDHFGNLTINISASQLYTFFCRTDTNHLNFSLNGKIVKGLLKNYSEIKKEQPLAIIGSRNYLEIAVNCGSAKYYFGAEYGNLVKVTVNYFDSNLDFSI